MQHSAHVPPKGDVMHYRLDEDKTAMELFDDEAKAPDVRVPQKAPVWRQPTAIELTKKDMTAGEKMSFLRNTTKRTWVIDPRTCKWMIYWDFSMILAMAFTAIVTPYQIAFLAPPLVLTQGADALWVANRISDVFFFADVLIVCNTMYQEPLVDGGMWVSRRSAIIKRYLKSGWLLIDAVSCFPYFIVGLIVEAASNGAEGGGGLMPLRLVKLVRMLKLTRCLKAAAKVGPYLQEVMMGYFELSYAKLQVILLFVQLILCARTARSNPRGAPRVSCSPLIPRSRPAADRSYTHLQACFWALFSSFTGGDGEHSRDTWVTEWSAEYLSTYGAPPEPWEVYVAALYFSAMTITSIGCARVARLGPTTTRRELPAASAHRVRRFQCCGQTARCCPSTRASA